MLWFVVQDRIYDREIRVVMDKPIREVEISVEINLAKQFDEEVKRVLDIGMMDETVGETILDVGLNVVSEDNKEGWTTVLSSHKGREERRHRRSVQG